MPSPSLPAHLAALPDPSWAVWRWTGLRGAGLPARLVEQVRSPDCARAAAEVIAAERLVDELLGRVRQPVRRALRELVGAPVGSRDHDRKRALRRLSRCLERGVMPAVPAADLSAALGELPAAELAEIAGAVADHPGACAAHAAAVSRFESRYAAAVTGEAVTLHAALGNPLVAEAMLWQNRHSVLRVSRRFQLLDPSDPQWTLNAARRRDLALVLSYLQRYCAKNDTIGFFGPMTWVRVDPSAPLLTDRPGPKLLSARTVRLESWGIEELARGLAEDPRLWPWLVPQRFPLVGVAGRVALQPLCPPVELTAEEVEVLLRCDGTREVRRIAAELWPPPGEAGLPRVTAVLERLVKAQLVEMGLPVPLALHPERALADRLARIDRPELRAEVSAPLRRLVEAAGLVGNAAGDVDRLGPALDRLDGVFTSITGREATRSHGQMYAARTLVYEECQRDHEVRIGSALLDGIGEPLSFVLSSGRWLCARVARVAELVLRQVYGRLVAASGTAEIGLPDLWLRAHELLFDPRRPLLEPVLADFRRRWAAVLGGPAETAAARAGELYRAVDEVRGRVREQFGGAGAPMRAVRHLSPDIMISAASAEAACRGEYLAVLGELHLASNTLVSASFVSVHPRPEELVAAWHHDLGDGYVSAVPAREWGYTVRTASGVRAGTDLELLIARDARAIRPDRAITMGDLVVHDRAGVLVARDRAGRYEGELLDTLGEALAPVMTNLFTITPPAPYQPRLRIGRLVVSRRTWRFDAGALDFAESGEATARFIGARRLQAAHGLPGRVFVRVPTERKPVYIDLDSVFGVDQLCALIRSVRAKDVPPGEVVFTEMLPDADGLWLHDVEGRHYTSELRLVAVDLWNRRPEGGFDR